MAELSDGLTGEQRFAAALGDLRVLAVAMAVGSLIFAAVNYWIGTLGWIAAASTASSTLLTSIGLLRRSDRFAAITKIGFGVSGLVAPVIAIVGLILGLLGYSWGWAVLIGAAVYFAFSLLGLEILERAADAGVINRF